MLYRQSNSSHHKKHIIQSLKLQKTLSSPITRAFFFALAFCFSGKICVTIARNSKIEAEGLKRPSETVFRRPLFVNHPNLSVHRAKPEKNNQSWKM